MNKRPEHGIAPLPDIVNSLGGLGASHRAVSLRGGKLSLRNYNAQVGETYAMIKALNKLTGLGMPETQYIV